MQLQNLCELGACTATRFSALKQVRSDRVYARTSILSFAVLLLSCLAVFALQFHSTALTCDDAYISFRYACNISDGLGPVFNEGERVEGYTNPLWVYILASGRLIGIRPELLAQALGFVAGASTIVLSFFLARAIAGQTRWALLVPLCLAGSRDLAAWSSSGLEMGLFVFLLLATLHVAVREREGAAQPISAALAVLAILTRPEGGLLGIVIGLFGIFTLKDRGLRIGIMVLLLGPFLAFRVGYYRQLVANSVVAKGGVEPLRGLFYVAEFLRSHPGAPIWTLFVLLFRKQVRWIGLLGVVHLAMLVVAGGDFMEFRLMVPVFALSVCCLPSLLMRLRLWLAWSLASVSVVGCLFGTIVVYRQTASPYMIESTTELNQNAHLWSRLGKFMKTAMRSHELIAVGPAGAIPYYSELPTIDMLGLCDTWVAKHGNPASNAAGHGKAAPREYLAQRGVVWLVGQPDVRRMPNRRDEKISVQLPWSQYLVLGTTLNADSLRSLLRERGFPVVAPDTAAMSVEGSRAVDQVIEGWRRLGDGEVEMSLRLAQEALRQTRRLGTEWRWLLREAGLLEHAARVRRGDHLRETKRWETIDMEIPEKWADALAQAKWHGSTSRLDSVGKRE